MTRPLKRQLYKLLDAVPTARRLFAQERRRLQAIMQTKRVSLFYTLSLLAAHLSAVLASALTFDRAACQYPTADPLQNCPSGTLLVGPTGNFSTIQSAVLSLPNDTTPYIILVEAGNYTEQVNVTRPGPLYLLGQTSAPNDRTQNRVVVYWAAIAGTGDNAYTSTLTVAPTLNASLTGAGPTGNPVPPGTPFGNTDFRVYNIDFINDYAPYSVSPSLAVSVSYANTGFYYTGFYSYQDTVRPFYLTSDALSLMSLVWDNRCISASSETRTSTTARLPARPTSFTASAPHGSSHPK